MKELTRIVVVVVAVVAVVLAPAALVAQGEFTLEGLAELVQALTARTDGVEERLAAIETQIAPPTATSTSVTTPTPQVPTSTPTGIPTSVSSSTYPHFQVKQIFDDYEANEASADRKYMGKIIDVTGKIVDVEKKGGGIFSGPERYEVTLDGEGFLRYLDCDFPLSSEAEVFELRSGDTTTLRGEVTYGSSVSLWMEKCSVVG